MSETLCTTQNCGREQVSAYLDGELSPSEELRFERHTATCAECLAELNQQKRLLSVLDSAFDETFHEKDDLEIKLPENFAKVVAVRAESNFNGLRSPKEWIFAILVILMLFALGVCFGVFLKRSEIILPVADQTAKVAWAIGNFIVSFGYDVSLSLVVVFRTLSRHFFFNSSISTLIIVVFLLVSFLLLSRLILKFPKS